MKPSRKYLITISGQDRPGITHSLTEVIDEPGIKLHDIEQSLTVGVLSLSFVIEFKETIEDETSYFKEMLFRANAQGLEFKFSALDGASLGLQRPSEQFAVTMMAHEIRPKHIATISKVLSEFQVNIDSIRKLTDGGLSCVELLTNASGPVEVQKLKVALFKAVQEFPGLDLALQKENLYRRSKHLVVMDMDSTLIQVEVIDELAKIAGVGEEVSAITERAMMGEIDYDESLRNRVALLKDLPESVLKDVAEKIPLTPGAEILIKSLKKLGYKIALISGGFSYFGKHLQKKLGLHYVFTNVLEIIDGKLTGKVSGPIVNAARKAELLEQIAAEEGVPLESTIAIGDGANDILMLKKAGLGIAFNAKAKTREAASAMINQKTLASILYLLGITDKDIEEITEEIAVRR